VRVDVPSDDGLDADRLRELPQPRVLLRVAPLVRALKLDEEAIAPEDRGQLGGPVAVPDRESVARAAGQADEPLVVHREQMPVETRRNRLGWLRTGACVSGGQQPAEVRVASRRFYEQRDVRVVGQRDLRAGDRPHAERLGRIREFERSVHAVVVGERERLVPELRRPSSELLGMRGSVEERIG
jgi:hypothetical protein